MNSTVSFILLESPSNFSVFIPPIPTCFLILSLHLSYFGHTIRKWCTVSCLFHIPGMLMLNRSRYSLSEFCPVLNRAIQAMCICLWRFLYIRELGFVRLGICFVMFHFVMFRRCFTVSFPFNHCFCCSRLIAWCISFTRADLRIVGRTGLIFSNAAFFAAWSALSFPSIPMCPGTHWNCMTYDGVLRYRVLISSRIRLMMACPDWRFGLTSDFMEGWLSEKIQNSVCVRSLA